MYEELVVRCRKWKWREEAGECLEEELLRRKPGVLIGGEIAGFYGW